MKSGDSKQVTIKPGNAYGPLNKDAISKIKEALTVRATLQGQSDE